MSSRKRRKHEKEGEERSKELVSDDNEASDDNSESDDSVDDAQSDDSDDSDHTNFINEEMQIEFCAHQPIDDDFNGIKTLLSQLWLKETIDLTELTQLLIQQQFICSVTMQTIEESSSEDEEKSDCNSDNSDDNGDVIIGVTSVISLSDNSDTKCINQIKSVLLKHIPKDNKVYQFIADNWDTIGLIVNERFANIPPKISLPSYQQLLSDINEAKDNKTNKLKLEYSSYLMIVKLVKTKIIKAPISSDGDNSNQLIYINAEDEIFDELSEHRFEYSVADQRDNDVLSGDWSDEHLFEPYRKILIISAENWLKAIDKLKDEFK